MPKTHATLYNKDQYINTKCLQKVNQIQTLSTKCNTV